MAHDSVLAPILYWGFNLMWTGAAAAGSVVAFQLMLRAEDGAKEEKVAWRSAPAATQLA